MKIAGILKKFASIRSHLKGLTFSVILLGNRIISGEFAANNTFAIYSPQCESSIIFATPHERPRMLTNTYECRRSFCYHCESVANFIRKPIRHIFATVCEFAANIIVLHSQGYSPQCESSITPSLAQCIICISEMY